MSSAQFRFYAELNDFLPTDRRQVTFVHPFDGRPSVKDTIEALGIPHTEVDLILANGDSVDFSYHLQDGDRISVYPVFEAIDIAPILRVRPQPLREARFVVNTHLGRLAGYLRMLGFDTLYRNDFKDQELAHLSNREGRILLTRDRGLLKRGEVTHGYFVRENYPRGQLVEVLQRFDLAGAVKPFKRCLCCNGLLASVRKEDIVDSLPAKTRQYYDQYRHCQTCGRIYWRGSHYQHMQRFIAQVLEESER